ncbi:transcriptional regulator, MerR family protein [Pedobacter sp. BAL39]|uniref:MerR family transcriptional regulator n=1 Tax=Pedobacter sp. BAL39 TaxID=391596 RepID=UPI0001559517|nr:MerR family transcriptional regulator [Pedobacter sp. BAL39]EDM36683.1 transcriptional regulator, MerR family protein [Pedobacter sp. BAL39]
MRYSISDLEQLSGVQTHTIRMWERRYQALEPMRSPGNTRFYDDAHLRRLLNIVSLSKSGMKISLICALSDHEMDLLLQQEMENTVSADPQYEYYISKLLNLGLAYNELKFSALLSTCVDNHGMGSTYQQVIYPLLVRLGLMWRRDHICAAQEHFLSNLIRQQLYVAIHTLPLAKQADSCWLLFLPEDEDHDLGLLFANYLLRSMGQKVIFLGARVPLASVKETMENNNVQHMLFFMVRQRPVPDANTYLEQLGTTFNYANIHLAGNANLIADLELRNRINWIQSIAGFEEVINKFKHAS